MSRGDERTTEPAAAIVSGLRPEQQQTATSSYFASFAWEPPAVDPERLTAAAFFARILGAEESDAPSGAAQSAGERYLDSVEIELVDVAAQSPMIADRVAASK